MYLILNRLIKPMTNYLSYSQSASKADDRMTDYVSYPQSAYKVDDQLFILSSIGF